MMNWLRKLFGCKPPPPSEPVEVGKALITVETEDRTYQSEFVGSYFRLDFMTTHDLIITTAWERVSDWQDRCGKRNMWSVDRDEHGRYTYVPTHLIKKITVKYEEHQVP